MKLLYSLFLFGFLFSSFMEAHAFVVKIDQKPANFTRPGHDGKNYSLADYKDKTVVLEWYNDDCPYVERHYGNGNMQKLQKQAKDNGIVWFSVISSAKGKQGHVNVAQATKLIAERKSHQTAILFDEEGTLGKAFGAKTTPHMYIIQKGKLVFAGGIDGVQSANPNSKVPKKKDFFRNALNLLVKEGSIQKIPNRTPEPYGCSVKYKS